MKCGLLGGKLGHSYSPQIHSHLGAYAYGLYEKQPQELADFLQNCDLTGFNVTIPYKKDVIPYCTELSPRAKTIGAVNTVVRRSDGSFIGHNTDYFGFEMMVRSSGLSVANKKVLVLGSGGTSKPVLAVLTELGANAVNISRSGENNYGNLDRHADAAVIVNTTPVGMFPNTGAAPLDIRRFPKLEGVLDAVYNPARTQLLLDAEALGLVAVNGLLMLVAQAKESAEWFTGTPIDDAKIHEIHRILRCQMENIILIGMPGCGKSTVGALLAARTGKKFVDADEFLTEKFGRPIPEIFASNGEEDFRRMEAEVLEELGKQSGLIIATGGGCVTREYNYPQLHQNGTIFCLIRDLDKLPTDGRPLSQANKLADMYRVRKPLYQRFADHMIDNNGATSDAAEQILKIWEGNQ